MSPNPAGLFPQVRAISADPPWTIHLGGGELQKSALVKSPLRAHGPPHKPPVTAPRLRFLAALLLGCSALTSPARAQSNITVDATKPIRVVDDRMFGVNTAVWDGVFSDSQTLATLQGMDARFLRFPGGSSSDDYIWTNNTSTEGAVAGSTTFDDFAVPALAINAQVVITTNYGTGTRRWLPNGSSIRT